MGQDLMQIKVCSVDMVPLDSIKQFYLGDLEVLIVNLGGHFFSLEGRCTHAGAPLGEGTMTGEVLTCPWHGSQFQITDGEVIKGPAEKQLTTYPTDVRGNAVFIEL